MPKKTDKAGGVPVQEPDIHGKHYEAAAELRPVHFEYDSSSLRGYDTEILSANAEVIRKHPHWRILIEGHCDERGTIPYNLSLGQRRASAVKAYYLMLGVPAGHVSTISFGEERPACPESGEECWKLNRRCETKVENGAAH